MKKDLILGLDIGTQSVKGLIVDLKGQIMAWSGLDRGPLHPNPGWVEMDVERDWWGAALQVIRKLLASPGIAAGRIAAAGVSGLVPCLGMLDSEGRALRPAILYSDNRALEEMEWVNRTFHFDLNAQAVLPKLLWVKRHEPQVFARTASLLSAHNYVVYRLTGRLSMDFDTACLMGELFDPLTCAWRPELSEQLGIPSHLWPPPSPATGIVGQVTAEAARATGIAAGTPVIAGSGDTFPTIVGCAAIEPGDAMLSLGTTGLLTVTNRPLAEAARGPHFDDNSEQGAVTWGANVLTAGRLVSWFSDHFAVAEQIVARRSGCSVFELLEAEARLISPGSEGLIVLPHLLGRRTPAPDANLHGSILGLSPSHGQAHIYRAILEAFAYNVKQSHDHLRPQIRRMVVTAGGARSPLWRQILADVLETTLEYHPGASGALGIAFLTAYATGLVDDFLAIKTRWLREAQRILPDPAATAIYGQLFPLYCQFDEALAVPYARLAAIRRYPG